MRRLSVLYVSSLPLTVCYPLFERILADKIVLVSKKVKSVHIRNGLDLVVMSICPIQYLECVSVMIHIMVSLALKIWVIVRIILTTAQGRDWTIWAQAHRLSVQRILANHLRMARLRRDRSLVRSVWHLVYSIVGIAGQFSKVQKRLKLVAFAISIKSPRHWNKFK